jgi:hypothetical protein
MATTNVARDARGRTAETSERNLRGVIERSLHAFVGYFTVVRLRQFFWLATGMFSASALSLAFFGYFAIGAAGDASRNFAAAVASSILFGAATILKLGPESS